MDNYPISSNSLDKFFHINGEQFGQQYKEHLSNYNNWPMRPHADDWMVFAQNIGSYLSIDETSLSNGELYTILTNKAAKGKKGVLVAMIKGTRAEDVVEALKIIPLSERRKVREITLDMAASMGQIARQCFPKATRVIDRFHVQCTRCPAGDTHKTQVGRH